MKTFLIYGVTKQQRAFHFVVKRKRVNAALIARLKRRAHIEQDAFVRIRPLTDDE